MKTRLINFTIPKSLLREVDLLAKRKAKSRSSVLRDAARLVTTRAKEKNQNFRLIMASARKTDMVEEDAARLIDRTRTRLQINK